MKNAIIGFGLGYLTCVFIAYIQVCDHMIKDQDYVEQVRARLSKNKKD